MRRSLLALATSLGASAAIGGIGSRNAPEVYAELDKPSWALGWTLYATALNRAVRPR